MSKPLYDPESEKTILAAILTEGSFDKLPANAPKDASDFTEANGIIFQTAQALAREGQPVNNISVTARLRESGELERAGGVGQVAEIITVGYYGSLLQYACDQVSELSRQRQILDFLGDIKRLHEEGNAEGAIEEMRKMLPVIEEMRAGKREPKIRFFSPGEIRAFEPDPGLILVGNSHITRGEVFVIGGEPGVGKSTAATELAFCGATGGDWLGLTVHCRFKTMIIQNENGRYRLQQEYRGRVATADVEKSILVSEPPPFGMTLDHPDFLRDVRRALEAFAPDVVIFDPWNAVAQDDRAKDYQAAFEALRGMLPTDPATRPALGIVAHTRKPQAQEKRIGGSSMMHLLAGSYVLSSVPRAIFVLVRGKAFDDADDSVVFFNPKTSNGASVSRTAWRRSPSGFVALPDFDWEEFDAAAKGEKRKVMEEANIRSVLEDGPIKKAEAIKRLEERTGFSDKACRNAFREDGKFTHLFSLDEDGKLHAR